MAVLRVATIKRFIGLSTDTKPTTDVPVGSTFYEYDTNLMCVTYDGTNWTSKGGSSTLKITTIDINQPADDYTLLVAGGGAVLIESVALRLPSVDCSDDAALTAISLETDDTTHVEILTAANGAVANLTAEAQFAYTTPFVLAEGKGIVLTIAGGAADAATVCTLAVKYRALEAGAYLSEDRPQATTVDLQQAAGDYDLYTAAGDVYISALSFTLPHVDCSDDATITGITIQTDDLVPVEIISAAAGAVANLTADAEFNFATPFILADTQKIQLTIAGGAADAPTSCTVVVTFRPIDAGAYLSV
jgi:hypothetical protein